MPINPTYPGVYLEEIQATVRTIIGVSTSVTAFIGRALMVQSMIQRSYIISAILIPSLADFGRRAP